MDPRNRFEWLLEEVAGVKTKKFFLFDGPATQEFEELIEQAEPKFPQSYRRFVVAFGNAKLYRLASGYELGVLAAPREARSAKGEKLWHFGYYSGHGAYFMESLLNEGKESPVFESVQGRLQRTADGFSEWLQERASQIRRRIGKHEWMHIVEGPLAFSDVERRIVQSRREFHWCVAGISNDGRIEFHVRNDSEMTLPFLSIGIRSKDSSFEGGVWLKVDDIPPGSEKIVIKGCYQDRASPETIEAFALPDPEPEDRERYWEFKGL